VELPKLTSVGGYLSIYSNVELQVPKLTSVGGYLYIYSNVELQAPKLTSVGGDLSIYSNVELQAPKLTSVGGDLYISSNVELPKLTSVGGDLYIYSKISISLEKRLWGKNRKKGNKWIVCDLVSDWLLERLSKIEKSEFRIDNVIFDYPLFRKIRDKEITAKEVFSIKNIEQRRVAYSKMPKEKMKELDYKILDEVENDGYGYSMKIYSFELEGFNSPFYFLNCFCPSTGREFMLETRQISCWKAKMNSFGLNEKERFIKEW